MQLTCFCQWFLIQLEVLDQRSTLNRLLTSMGVLTKCSLHILTPLTSLLTWPILETIRGTENLKLKFVSQVTLLLSTLFQSIGSVCTLYWHGYGYWRNCHYITGKNSTWTSEVFWNTISKKAFQDNVLLHILVTLLNHALELGQFVQGCQLPS